MAVERYGLLTKAASRSYQIGFAIVSLIFVANACGFLAAAFAIDGLQKKIGSAKSLVIAELLIILGYTMILLRPLYSVVVLAYDNPKTV